VPEAVKEAAEELVVEGATVEEGVEVVLIAKGTLQPGYRYTMAHTPSWSGKHLQRKKRK